MASARSQISISSLSQTPQAAMVSVPIVFTAACTMELATGNSTDCSASGMPVRTMAHRCSSHRRSGCAPILCGSFFPAIHSAIAALTIWAKTVAIAAPAVPIPSPPTSRMSPTMLIIELTSRIYRGLLEFPKARRTPEAMLYKIMAQMPPK